MPTKTTSTGVTFPDSTVQTTAATAAGFSNVAVFTTSGSFTPLVTKAHRVRVVGAGGSGGAGSEGGGGGCGRASGAAVAASGGTGAGGGGCSAANVTATSGAGGSGFILIEW